MSTTTAHRKFKVIDYLLTHKELTSEEKDFIKNTVDNIESNAVTKAADILSYFNLPDNARQELIAILVSTNSFTPFEGNDLGYTCNS